MSSPPNGIGAARNRLLDRYGAARSASTRQQGVTEWGHGWSDPSMRSDNVRFAPGTPVERGTP